MTTGEDKRLSDKRLLFIILALALIIRIIYLYIYQNLTLWDQLTVDNYYHHHWAQRLANGDIFNGTTYFRAPFYIYCLGFLYWVFGSSLWVGRLFGLVIGLGSISLTFLIGRKLFNQRTGMIAALIQAVFPIVIYFESELLLDPLFMVLLQAGIYCFIDAYREAAPRKWLYCGICLGLAAITRPTGLIFIVILAVLLILQRRTASIRRSLFNLILPVLVLSGFTLFHNLITARDPVLISSQGGINFYIGNNAAADGVSAVMPEPLGYNWEIQDITHLAEKAEKHILKPGEVSSYWYRQGLKWITTNPGKFIKLFLTKLYLNFSNTELSNNRDIQAFMLETGFLSYIPLSFGLILPLAIIGFAFSWRRDAIVKILFLSMIAYIVMTSFFFVNSRFRLPLLPFYFILAAFTLSSTREISQSGKTKGILTIVVLILAAFISIFPFYGGNPDSYVQSLLADSRFYINNRQYSAALPMLHRARRADPAFPEVNLNLGICFFRMGEGDSARFYFNREIDYHPQRSRGYTNLASYYLVNDNYRKALELVDKALVRRPYDRDANLLYLRAAGLSDEIDSDSMASIIRDVRYNTEDNLYILNEAAIILTHKGAPDQAERILIAAVNKRPPPVETDDAAFKANYPNSPVNYAHEKARTYYQLGYLKGSQGDYFLAEEYSRKAIELRPDLFEAYLNLMSAYYSQGNMNRADSILQVAREKFPDNPQIQKLPKSLDQ